MRTLTICSPLDPFSHSSWFWAAFVRKYHERRLDRTMAMSDTGPMFEYEILKEEFADRFGPLSRRLQRWEFSREQISDHAAVIALIKKARASASIPEKLWTAAEKNKDGLVHLLNVIKSLKNPAEWNERIPITPEGSEKLKADASRFGEKSADNLKRRLAEMVRRTEDDYGEDSANALRQRLLVENELDWLILSPDALLKSIRLEFHSRQSSALCLSGGGIRSATFALGVVQGLAQARLLDKFTFMSTVSGGGYAGGWLSAWMHRDGGPEVAEQLREAAAAEQDEQPQPLRFLRQYSNYLTPRVGLASADTWAAVGGALRNIILNWTVFVPLLFALAALPMLSDFFICWGVRDFRLTVRFITALLVALLPMLFVSAWRPSLEWAAKGGLGPPWSWIFGSEPTTKALMLRCLALLSLAGFLVTMASFEGIAPPLFEHSTRLDIQTRWPWLSASDLGITALSWLAFLGLAIFTFGWLVPIILAGLFRPTNEGSVEAPVELPAEDQIGIETVAYVLITGAFWGSLQWAAIRLFNTYADPVYYCFAPALSLTVFLLAATLFVGLISKRTTDEDREWWARFGGYVLLIIIGWTTLCFTSIVGPNLLDWMNHDVWGAVLHAILTGAGISALWGGHTGKTKGETENQDSTKLAAKLPFSLSTLITVAGMIFLLYFMSIIAWIVIGLTGEWPGDPNLHLLSALLVTNSIGSNASAGDLSRLIILILGTGIGLVAASTLSVNRFSLHAIYRSRLTRAYLGASNLRRRPNPFTGFDPNDNVRMHELRLIHADALEYESSAWQRIIRVISGLFPTNASEFARLYTKLSVSRSRDNEDELKRQVAGGLDILVRDRPVELLKELGETPGTDFEDTRTKLLKKICRKPGTNNSCSRLHRPLHVINMTLNLVSGKNLAWQQRKGESFTVTPLHGGSARLGYRDSLTYAAQLKEGEQSNSPGISLGTCIAISGAAASPNMGYFSSPVVTLLMTLFNLRLGWWLGNPGAAGQNTFQLAEPRFALAAFLAEALGRTSDESSYVYLSDGGHFENLGLYEMVRRRCRYIIVSDASADKDYHFSDLANAIQKIRVDQGIEITFSELTAIKKYSDKNSDQHGSAKHYALGTINYRAVDGDYDPLHQGKIANGILLYIKASLTGDEPADVINYWKEHPDFPHQSTANQWFNETQFESYRNLGLHSVNKIIDDPAFDASKADKSDRDEWPNLFEQFIKGAGPITSQSG